MEHKHQLYTQPPPNTQVRTPLWVSISGGGERHTDPTLPKPPEQPSIAETLGNFASRHIPTNPVQQGEI